MLKRRSFLAYSSISWLTICFPTILAAYDPSRAIAHDDVLSTGDKDSRKPVAQKKPEDFIVVGSVSDLDKNGYLQTKEVAVIRNPYNPQKVIAVNPKCTHQGCDVKWVVGEKRYECPCHDSDFAADGKVLKGPASTSLATYPAKIVGTQVLVKI